MPNAPDIKIQLKAADDVLMARVAISSGATI
jgi:hypothetical protein